MDIGYAICDVTSKGDFREIYKLLGKVDKIEIQRESRDSWNSKEEIDLIRSLKDKGVHLPCGNIDLSSLDEAYRSKSIELTKAEMDYANTLNAEDFIIHPVNTNPVNSENFFNLNERKARVDNFLGSFREIGRHYFSSRHKYEICIENVEFPKYPATIEEMFNLSDMLRDVYEVMYVFDIPHLWNSRRMILENPRLIHEFPGIERSLGEHIDNLLENELGGLNTIHVAQFTYNPIQTHAIIQDKNNIELMEAISKVKEYSMVLEVYDDFPNGLISSKRHIEEYCNGRRE